MISMPSNAARIVLLAIALTGLVVRLAGLSHDLDEGFVYHPDSPKQMYAAQTFLNGRYDRRIGNPDYDAYPYLNSHLVELVVRGWMEGERQALSLVGVRRIVEPPGILAFYWITRILNTTLSTLSIVVVYWIGRRAFGGVTALLAATFLALSPIDVVASHFATSDATAAFFALLSIGFALRLLDGGRPLDYAAATVFATLGFAAKYHAGLAILAMLTAHVVFWRRRGGLLSRPAMSRLVAALLTGVATLVIAIPPLATHPAQFASDLIHFLRHASSVNTNPELGSRTLLERFPFSLQRNVPILVRVLGPPVSLVLPAVILLAKRRRASLAVLSVVPLVYVLLALPIRPGAHAIYHTLVTPLLFLFAAAVIVAAPSLWPRARRGAAATAAIIAALAVGVLTRTTLCEDFFFYRHDTSRMARQWTIENTPQSFPLRTLGYTFRLPRTVEKPLGFVIASSSLRLTKSAREVFLKRFRLEDDPLPVFRNATIDIAVESSILRPGFFVPTIPRLPSTAANDFVFEGGAEFYRSENRFVVTPGMEIVKTIVTESPLRDAAIAVENGDDPTVLRISFGGHDWRLWLDPGESSWLPIEALQERFPSGGAISLYEFRTSAKLGAATVTIATTPSDHAIALFGMGRYAEAIRWLSSLDPRDPAACAMRTIVGAIADSGKVTDRPSCPLEPVDRAALNRLSGGAVAYLDRLDGLTFEAEIAPAKGLRAAADSAASGDAALVAEGDGPRSVTLALPPLEPGAYRARIRARSGGRGAALSSVALIDRAGATGDERPGGRSLASGFTEARVPFEVPDRRPWMLELRAEGDVVIDRVEVAPDAVAHANELLRVATALASREPGAASGDLLAYAPLLALGDRLASEGRADDAYRFYAAAAALRPARRRPLEAIAAVHEQLSGEARADAEQRLHAAPIVERRSADASFGELVRLTECGSRQSAPPQSRRLALDLRWRVASPSPKAAKLAVIVALLDASARVILEDVHPLVDDLRRAADDGGAQPFALELPSSVRSGSYRIAVGLRLDGRPLPLRSSVLASDGDRVILPETLEIR